MSRPADIRLCDDCGKPTFWNYSVSSFGGGKEPSHTHGDCEKAAAALERMPLALDAAISALIYAYEAAGRLIFQGSDEEYADVRELQMALHDAYAHGRAGIDKISAALAGTSGSARRA